MLVRRLLAVSSLVLGMVLSLAAAGSAVAGHAPYPFQGARQPVAGEPQMIVAINLLDRALQIPQASQALVRAAEVHLNTALRLANNRHTQHDLTAALQMLNSYRYRGELAALSIARERVECALAEARETRYAPQTYRPVLPQTYPPAAYPPAYPVPYQNNGLTISKGAFSITIPLGR